MHVELTPAAQQIIEAAIERGEFATPEQLVDSVLTAWAGVPCADAGDHEPLTMVGIVRDGRIQYRDVNELIEEARQAAARGEIHDWTPEHAASLLERARQAVENRRG
ncbi:MAG: hypothetical protein IT303_19880 [Dehalococcoidia bacterium]|nr:hypothetical protein [Dehalococcoidia bacterium]